MYKKVIDAREILTETEFSKQDRYNIHRLHEQIVSNPAKKFMLEELALITRTPLSKTKIYMDYLSNPERGTEVNPRLAGITTVTDGDMTLYVSNGTLIKKMIEPAVICGLFARIDELVSTGQLSKETKVFILTNLHEWLTDKTYQEYLQELNDIITKNTIEAWNDLIERFKEFVVFGTAGRRAKMGAGTNRLNKITVAFSAQSQATALRNAYGDKASVVIGGDTRNNSMLFSEITASVMLANGIKVYLFKEAVPMPENCFAIRFLEANGGVEITASHNAKEYNGYKEMSGIGAQLFPNQKDEIVRIESTQKVSDIKYAPEDIYEYRRSGKLVVLGDAASLKDGAADFDIDTHYFAQLKGSIKDTALLAQYAKDIHVIYDGFYGSGIKKLPPVMKAMGIENLFFVEEHMVQNGNFPNIKLPDPGARENMAAAYTKAELLFKQTGRYPDIIMGTDPDADRAGVAILIPETYRPLFGSTYLHLTANKAWTLLNYYDLLISQGSLPEEAFLGKSWVTDDLMAIITKAFGVNVVETGVGYEKLAKKTMEMLAQILKFKNETNSLDAAVEQMLTTLSIAGVVNEMQKYLISNNEESNGYNADLEKDGSTACLRFLELSAFALSKGTTVFELLFETIFRTYGMTVTSNVPKEFEGLQGMLNQGKVFDHVIGMSDEFIRAGELTVAGINVKGTIFRDNPITEESFDTTNKKGKDTALARGIRFNLESDDPRYNHITARPSGTEPKGRIYTQLYTSPETLAKLSTEAMIAWYLDMEKRADAIGIEFINTAEAIALRP